MENDPGSADVVDRGPISEAEIGIGVMAGAMCEVVEVTALLLAARCRERVSA